MGVKVRISLFNRDSKKRVSKQEKLKRERISLKLKLTISHILIAVLPILIIVMTLTSKASSSLLEKVNSSNLAYVSKVTKIIDGSIKSMEDVTRIIISDQDLNASIRKEKKDYKSEYLMMKDRETNFDQKIRSLQFSYPMIQNIFLVKKSEILGYLTPDENLAFKDFFTSDVYQRVVASEMSPIWLSNLYGSDDLYLMRSVNSIDTGKAIGVLIIQVKKELLLENLKSDFGSLAKIALIEPSGKVILTPKDQLDLGKIQYFDRIIRQINTSIEKEEALVGTFVTDQGVDNATAVLYGSCSNN